MKYKQDKEKLTFSQKLDKYNSKTKKTKKKAKAHTNVNKTIDGVLSNSNGQSDEQRVLDAPDGNYRQVVVAGNTYNVPIV